MEDPITRTCSRIVATGLLALAAAQPLSAKALKPAASPMTTYVQARAAEMNGDLQRSARLLSAIAKANPSDRTIVRRAIVIAIQAGEADLAIPLAKTIPADQMSFDARLLLAADAMRRNRNVEALAILGKGTTTTEIELFDPLVRAWVATASGGRDGVASFAKLPGGSPLAGLANEQRALMLLVLGDVDAAKPLVDQLAKEQMDVRTRLAFAQAFAERGRTDSAAELLAGSSRPVAERAGKLLAERKSLGMAIDSPAKAYSAVLVKLATDLLRDENKALPIALTQVARHADPDNVSASILLALLLDGDGRTDNAVRILAEVPAKHVLAPDAASARISILSRRNRNQDALRSATLLSAAPEAGSDALRSLGDVLGDMKRHSEASEAYAKAIAKAKGEGESGTRDLWVLHLLRAASLEEIDRWAEAKAELQHALALEPENPVLLNFLGYGKLERGEDIASAEAMIRKASMLRPDDVSITDSLGWALFKTGRNDEAIATLRKAAAADAAEAEIHEHLGDALYKGGRRIEARFSWEAAVLTAEGKAKDRLQAKLEYGLDPSNAAP